LHDVHIVEHKHDVLVVLCKHIRGHPLLSAVPALRAAIRKSPFDCYLFGLLRGDTCLHELFLVAHSPTLAGRTLASRSVKLSHLDWVVCILEHSLILR